MSPLFSFIASSIRIITRDLMTGVIKCKNQQRIIVDIHDKMQGFYVSIQRKIEK